MTSNPFNKAKREFADLIASHFNISRDHVFREIEIPPREELGDLALPLNSLGLKDAKLGERPNGRLLRKVEQVGTFINAFLNEGEMLKEVTASLDTDYGFERVGEVKRMVVEHTSANPIHPMHVGHLRNAVLGDSIARLLRKKGNQINVRFYVNDSGRQVGILAYGLSKLGWRKPPSERKPDHWYGLIYAITNTLVEINKARKSLYTSGNSDERRETQSKLDELTSISKELRERDQQLFDEMASLILNDEDPEAEISRIIRDYESGNLDLRERIREFVNNVLRGFLETMNGINVSFDDFDFESDLLWSGEVKEIVERAMQTRFVGDYKGTKALFLQDFLSKEVRENLRIPSQMEVPPLVLMRSDGTSLYPVRDLAYTLRKFREFNADVVINVIAEQQTLPQTQLRGALYLLGFRREAENLIHYSYSMVNLQGMRMSGRAGRYVTVDDLLSMIKERIKQLVESRKGEARNLNSLASAALRYAMLSISAKKPLSFSVERATDLEQNSGPYLQYTYVRAYNILNKSTEKLEVERADPGDLVGEKRRILIQVSKFPEVVDQTYYTLQLETLANYVKDLADSFNRWYSSERVLQEADQGKRMTRLLLVKAVETVLRNSFEVLGIDPLTRM